MKPTTAAMLAATPDADVIAPTDARVEALVTDDHRRLCVQTDRVFAYLLLAQWVFAIVLAVAISPFTWAGNQSDDPSARLDRGRGRRTGLRAARLPGLCRARAATHPPCRRHRPDGHRRPPDPSHRRPHRDPLPRLRIAGLPRGVPRSEGAGDRDARGARRSRRPQRPVAGLGLRRQRRLHVASARARRLGGVRGRRALRPLRPRRGRGARHGPAPGGRRGAEGDDRGPRRAPHRAAPGEPRPARDRQRRAARRLGPRRGIVPLEVGLPRHRQPRSPHADERHHRRHRAAARHRPLARPGRVRRDHRAQRPQPARDHQRHPRLLEARGRQAGDRVARVRPARPDRPRPHRRRPQGGGQAPRLRRGGRAGCPAARRRRRRAAEPGPRSTCSATR